MNDSRGVLLVGNYPPPYGGVPSHLSALAAHLNSNGWRVHVLSPKYKSLDENASVDGVFLHSLEPARLTLKLAEFTRFAPHLLTHRGFAFANLRRFYHVVHLANRIEYLVREQNINVISAYHVLPAGLACAWVSARNDVPLVTTVFGEVWVDKSLFTTRALEARVALLGSEVVLAPSEHCADGARRHGYSTDVTYYGVDLDRFSGNARAFEDPLAKQLGSGPVVAFVGRMEEEMGLHVLLEALPSLLALNDHLVVIVAGRSGTCTKRVFEACQRHGDRVHIFPDATNVQVANLYALATVVVVPSINERACLGLAIAEASASSKPVVASDVGGGPEVLGPGAGTLVPAGDPTALVRAVAGYIADPAIARAAGIAGRAFVEENFDHRQTNRAVEEILARQCE